jgi:Rrf2 family transcriptional regulator, iron-sulfur cluster assembly transcription factor
MISQTVRYAFRILGRLAGSRDGLVRGEELADATGIPANYLSKILNQLRKAGFVESQKGWGGGFRLREEALQRPIRDVLVVFDGTESLERRDCAFGLPQCDTDNPCPLHEDWEGVRTAVRSMLDRTTVQDLAGTT